FLHHLALSHALFQRWQTDKVQKGSPAKVRAERERALDYIRKNKGTAFGWVLLSLLQDRAKNEKAFHKALAELWPLFEDVPGLSYAARYEEARSLWKAGRKEEARKRFRALYEKTLRNDLLPQIDEDFRAALLGDGKDTDPWSELIRKTAERLI